MCERMVVGVCGAPSVLRPTVRLGDIEVSRVGYLKASNREKRHEGY
jgi:hypothetical protein